MAHFIRDSDGTALLPAVKTAKGRSGDAAKLATYTYNEDINELRQALLDVRDDARSNVVNVKHYGAKGDGVTDDAAAFNAAVTAAAAVKGVAYAPPGTYLLKSTVSIPSNCGFRGAGRGTLIVVPDAGFVGERVITNSDVAGGNVNIDVGDFAIKATSGSVAPMSGTRPGIVRFERVTGLSVERIYTESYDCRLTPVDLSGGIRNATVRGCIIKNEHTATAGGAIWVRGGQDSDAEWAATTGYALGAVVKANGNLYVATTGGTSGTTPPSGTGTGITDGSVVWAYQRPNQNAYDITVTGNVLEATADEAFGLYGWMNNISRVTVTGNVIINRNSVGTKPSLSFLGYNVVSQDGTVTDVIASGNYIIGKTNILTGASRINMVGNTILGPTGASMDAILVSSSGGGITDNPTDINVSDNFIYASARYGIFNAAADTTIRNNRIHGTTDNGINTSAGVVEGNFVKGSGTTNIHATGTVSRIVGNVATGATTGINVFGATSNVLVADNEVVDATATGISINANFGAVSNVSVERNRVRGLAVTTVNGIRAFNGGTFTGCRAEGNHVHGATNEFSLPTAGWRAVGNYSGTAQDAYPRASGTTAQRPTLGTADAGCIYRDTTLDADGLPIMWNGSKWIRFDGTDA